MPKKTAAAGSSPRREAAAELATENRGGPGAAFQRPAGRAGGATGTLFVVATPIGNLQDITLRALATLRACDAVVAEDTRHTRRLLTAHGIARPLLSLPAFDEGRRVPPLLMRLAAGENLALCSDAGTPALSDPGALLVGEAHRHGHPVLAIPGPSALTAAISAAGLGGGGVCFLGFLPRTPGKLTRTLSAALTVGLVVGFFESPHRLAKTLRTAAPVLGDREVVVARELTKVHEQLHRGTAAALAEAFAADPPRGECTVLVGTAP